MGKLIEKISALPPFQIFLTNVVLLLTIASIVFMIMFIVEVSKKEKEEPKAEEKSLFDDKQNEGSNSIFDEEQKEEKDEEDKPRSVSVSEMLANLDEISKQDEEEYGNPEEPAEETPAEETVENAEPVEEPAEETPAEETVENAEPVEELAEETTESHEPIPMAAPVEISEEQSEEQTEKTVENSEDQARIAAANVEYQNRLDSVIQNRENIRKDIAKYQKDILKYERTERRRERNQKMLDRRAGELTNLNLVMYSVTDIKNVDEDKKKKQVELTSHIAELKASIQDADEYLDSNKDKNEHNISMVDYLQKEENRYNEEIEQLESLIKSTSNSDADSEQ